MRRNIKELKEIYTHYFYQVDAEANREEILEDIAVSPLLFFEGIDPAQRLIKYRIKSNAPKRTTKILVLGAPGLRLFIASLLQFLESLGENHHRAVPRPEVRPRVRLDL